jgi:penicillin G amidase
MSRICVTASSEWSTAFELFAPLAITSAASAVKLFDVIPRLLGLFLVLAIVTAAGGYGYLRTSLPSVEGRLVLRGPKAAIDIVRDADGVPTIIARDDEDAAFGLGFVHAQDRLFQMELMRRYAAGRLSEILGPQALPADRLMRVLGLYRLAEAEISYLSPDVVRGLRAYAAGVNAFLATRRGALPPEFLLLRFGPEPWRVADSLVWGKLMALQLGGDYRGALLRARLARTVSAADLAILYPHYPEDAPTILSSVNPSPPNGGRGKGEGGAGWRTAAPAPLTPALSPQWGEREMFDIYRRLPLDRLYAALPPIVGPIHASNNWVVDGRHSASGKPLLANDPHLGFSAPGFWYLARLKTPAHDIVGGTAAGVPLVVVGHNERIAWGLTTTGAAIEDLFIEKLDPADPGRYLTPQGSAAFTTRQERIGVRGATPVALTVRESRHGPILSDVLPPDAAAPGYALALSATFLQPQDRSAEAIWRLDRAGDWAGFRAALKDFVGPPQNVVYGDGGGTIGFLMPGLVPLRGKGEGWLPVPGWTGEYDWQGFVPFDMLPSIVNPPAGYVVSANNKVEPKGYPYFIGRGWDLPNRAERIAALLGRTPRQTPQSSAAIQADTVSLMARRLVPLMTRIEPPDDVGRWAVDRLRRWHGHMDRDKVEPLLFTAWLREFSHDLLFGRFGEAMRDYWDLKPQVVETVLTRRQDWCVQPGAKDCDALLAKALAAALLQLRRALSMYRTRWYWGRLHVAVFADPVLDHVPVLADFLRYTIATSGGYDTVDRGATTIRDPHLPYEQRFGAGLRMITDLAQPDAGWAMTVPGQSGNPLSSHFADLLRRWRDFAWLTPGRRPASATLTLVPEK